VSPFFPLVVAIFCYYFTCDLNKKGWRHSLSCIKLYQYTALRQAMNTSLDPALEKYLNTISQKKAINTHMQEKVAAERLISEN